MLLTLWPESAAWEGPRPPGVRDWSAPLGREPDAGLWVSVGTCAPETKCAKSLARWRAAPRTLHHVRLGPCALLPLRKSTPINTPRSASTADGPRRRDAPRGR